MSISSQSLFLFLADLHRRTRPPEQDVSNLRVGSLDTSRPRPVTISSSAPAETATKRARNVPQPSDQDPVSFLRCPPRAFSFCQTSALPFALWARSFSSFLMKWHPNDPIDMDVDALPSNARPILLAASFFFHSPNHPLAHIHAAHALTLTLSALACCSLPTLVASDAFALLSLETRSTFAHTSSQCSTTTHGCTHRKSPREKESQ
jgi:hypothetical protein